MRRSPTASASRDLVWRAILQCAGARWRSLEALPLPRRSRRGGPAEARRDLVGLIQSRSRRRLQQASRPSDGTAAGNAKPEALPGPIALRVELAFQHLQLAEQRLLLGEEESALLHCRQFVHSLLSAAVDVLGEGLGREEEELVLGTARHLPGRLAAQIEVRQALRSGALPERLIFVLGMHRSGTSALSGLLCQAGFDAPADLMAADAVNPRGYWESQGLFALNEGLLETLGSRWDDPLGLPVGWQDREEVQHWRSRVLALLGREFAGARAPVIKDPRLCLLLEGLTPWLESGAPRMEMLLTLRHPLEVASSLEKAQNLPSPRGLRLWLQHVFAAERTSRGLPRRLLTFENLIQHPQRSLESCLALLGRERQDSGASEEASRFVLPELHRQRRASLPTEMQKEMRSIASSRDLALAVYELLCREDLNAPATAARLDALAAHGRLLQGMTQPGRSLT